MNKYACLGMVVLAVMSALCGCATCAHGPEGKGKGMDDYSWVRGANFIPSYAATDVEIWRDFDPVVVDRELGYAERLKLNSVRMFLQYHVYENDPAKFLKNVSTFVDLCAKHQIRPMLILFDSCFGVAPSMTSGETWVANPGPHRTNPEFYPAGEKYVKDLVDLFKGDDRILFWDIMNEPNATPLALTDEGKKQIWDFVRHFADYVAKIDGTHPTTVGIAGHDNSEVAEHIDVLCLHSYAKTAGEFREHIQLTRDQAQKAGKPLIISECGAPGWDCQYETIMPVLRDEKIGYYVWEVMIARTQFRSIAGLCYPDGTVRRLSNIEAILGAKPEGFVEKPDSEGVPISASLPPAELLAPTFTRMTKTPTTAENFPERSTFLSIMIRNAKTIQGEDMEKALTEAERLEQAGKDAQAFAVMDKLLPVAKKAFDSTLAK